MTTSTFRLSGNTMLDGYAVDCGARRLTIEIIGGRAYEIGGLSVLGDHAEPLRLTEDGELSDSARGGFLPDIGEIERVEGIVGRQVFVRA